MRSTLLLALPGLALAQVPAPAADGRYTVAAEGIKAQFIPYGATLTNLWVKDRHGNDTDVVLGYDDAAYYRKCLRSCCRPLVGWLSSSPI